MLKGDKSKLSANQSPKKVEEKDVKMADGNEREFKMLGFTPRQKVPRAHFMAGVDVILP